MWVEGIVWRKFNNWKRNFGFKKIKDLIFCSVFWKYKVNIIILYYIVKIEVGERYCWLVYFCLL